MKTAEKPRMKSPAPRVTLETRFLRSPDSSLTASPVVTERYTGTRGMTQGEAKEITPALNASA